MKLIDADKLCDWIKTECNPYGKPTIDFESGNRMLDIIKRMPTAFDKEKVIEQMQKHSHNYYPNIDHYCLSRKAVDLKDAVDIVKKGGIE